MSKFEGKGPLKGSFVSHIGELCLSWEYQGQYLNIRLSPDETRQIRTLLSCEHREQINRMLADYELEITKFQVNLLKLEQSGEYENATVDYGPIYFYNIMRYLLRMLQDGENITPEQAYTVYMHREGEEV